MSTCAIEVIYEHEDPHPEPVCSLTLADGDVLKICRDCAQAFILAHDVVAPVQ